VFLPGGRILHAAPEQAPLVAGDAPESSTSSTGAWKPSADGTTGWWIFR
jgi:hypothetical protein